MMTRGQVQKKIRTDSSLAADNYATQIRSLAVHLGRHSMHCYCDIVWKKERGRRRGNGKREPESTAASYIIGIKYGGGWNSDGYNVDNNFLRPQLTAGCYSESNIGWWTGQYDAFGRTNIHLTRDSSHVISSTALIFLTRQQQTGKIWKWGQHKIRQLLYSRKNI